MEDVQSWLAGACGFSASAPPPPPDSAPGLAAPLDPSFVSVSCHNDSNLMQITKKLRQLAGEGLTVEVAAYLDRLGIAVCVHGVLNTLNTSRCRMEASRCEQQ